jgi:hypothetical protein
MRYLSLLLLGPWLIVLAWVYWLALRKSRGTWMLKAYDLATIVVALAAAYGFALTGYDDIAVQNVGSFGRESGSIWKQVMPALYGYGAFAVVMVAGLLARWLFRRRRHGAPGR